jgi:hypothetical protein
VRVQAAMQLKELGRNGLILIAFVWGQDLLADSCDDHNETLSLKKKERDILKTCVTRPTRFYSECVVLLHRFKLGTPEYNWENIVNMWTRHAMESDSLMMVMKEFHFSRKLQVILNHGHARRLLKQGCVWWSDVRCLCFLVYSGFPFNT